MVFNSLTFVVFFLVVLGSYYTVNNWKSQKTILLLASYLFYAAWNPPFVALLWLSTIIDWYAAKGIESSTDTRKRRLYMFISLLLNLGLLGYFKYGGFILENVKTLCAMMGMTLASSGHDIILPVGISFYTFQTLSYTLDVYRRESKPANSFLDFALYVTFFPQLVAGPIVRAADFLPQCESPRKATSRQFFWGLYLMTLGLFQKVVLADTFMATASDTVFNWNKGPLHILDAWVGTLAFTGQIFFDFAGYSTTAIGVALCFGFILTDNFKFPYAAIGFSDFWRRWHMSLSTWLRDYLYIPLGGNKHGTIRTLTNLMITMFIGGLWHGAAWTFVFWGVLHGLYLMLERLLQQVFRHKNVTQHLPVRMVLRFITLFFVCLAWVFFRAKTFEGAMLLIMAMLGVIPDGAQILPTIELYKVLVVFAGLVGIHWFLRENNLELAMEKMPSWWIATIWTAMIIGLIVTQGGGNAFIYFQF